MACWNRINLKFTYKIARIENRESNDDHQRHGRFDRSFEITILLLVSRFQPIGKPITYLFDHVMHFQYSYSLVRFAADLFLLWIMYKYSLFIVFSLSFSLSFLYVHNTSNSKKFYDRIISGSAMRCTFASCIILSG